MKDARYAYDMFRKEQRRLLSGVKDCDKQKIITLRWRELTNEQKVQYGMRQKEDTKVQSPEFGVQSQTSEKASKGTIFTKIKSKPKKVKKVTSYNRFTKQLRQQHPDIPFGDLAKMASQ